MAKRKVYDVDRAVAEHRPLVRLRGVMYPVRSMSLQERINHILAFEQQQKKIQDRLNQGDAKAISSFRTLMGDAAKTALENLPDGVAQDLTEQEFDALMAAVNDARGIGAAVLGKDEDFPEEQTPVA